MIVRPLLPAALFAVLACTAVPALAQHVTAIDPAKSEIKFVSKQMNVPVDGRFRKFSAKIDFDPARPAASKAEIEVDLNSVDTGSDEADSEVKSKGWFNIAVFPSARFVSSAVKPTGAGRYEVSGKLSIKGKAMDVTAPVTVKQEGGNTVFEGAFTLMRLQYGIGEGMWSDTDTVANEVQVRFRLVGLGKKQ
jgi:polyisoprenoid-binding protein YceI